MSLLLSRTVSTLQRTTSPPSAHILCRPPQEPAFQSRYSTSKPRKDAAGKNEEPPQFPKFSLDSLGATPAMKAVIYTAIGIMATAETYTYGLWIYHKLYPQPVVEAPTGSEKEG